MTEPTFESLRLATGQATFDLAARTEALRFRRGQAPSPGDTFVFPETAGVGVTWAVIDRHPDERRLRVVPVDTYPQVGSRDLTLDPEGVHNIRCDLDTWLESAVFDPALRTGVLEPAGLEEVRRKRAAIADGSLVPTLPEEEVDGDPEYHRWRSDTLQTALRALPIAATPRRQLRPYFALAATVILVVAFAGLREIRELHRQLSAARVAMSELEASKVELEASNVELEASQEALEGRLEASAAELEAAARREEQLAEQLAAAQDTATERNLPVARLTYGDERRRSGSHELRIPAGARTFALLIEVVDPEDYSSYRLRFVDASSHEEVWSTDDLVLIGTELSLSLPVSVAPPGEYRLLIEAMTEAGPVALEESYRLEILHAGPG